MKEYAPVSNEHQAILHNWHKGIYGGEPTLQSRIDQHKQEHEEVLAEVEGLSCEELNSLSGEKARKLAEETVDQIITDLGILSCLGYDFQNLFFEKMQTVYEKYNVVTIEMFMEDGYSREDAMHKSKEQWKSAHRPTL